MPLLNNFEKSSKKTWKAQAIKDLKDKDFDSSLLSFSKDGFLIEPYYTESDFCELNIESIQNAQLYNKQDNNAWLIEEKINSENNQNAQLALSQGATALYFCDIKHFDVTSISKMLLNVKLTETPVLFETNQPIELLQSLIKLYPSQFKGGIIAKEQQYFEINTLKEILILSNKSTNFSAINIKDQTDVFEKSGEAVQVSNLIFHALEITKGLINESVSLEKILNNLQFNIRIGKDFFIEIAKLRALKYLFAQIIYQTYDILVTPKIRVIIPKSTTQNLSDDQQLIASTFQAMAAVIGGCDTLSIEKIYEHGSKSNDFSSRITKNISLILNEEGYLGKVIDPAAGSYYVECMTQKISEEALSILR